MGALRRRAYVECAGKMLPGQTLAEAEISVLKRLEVGGPVTTADLARAERITPQSMGALVATLESAGYLSRHGDANDGRRRLATLSAAGRKALSVNRAARLRWLTNDIEEKFDTEERRVIAAALSLLHRLVA